MEKKRIIRILGKRKAYILTFDREDSIDYKKFHDSLTTLPEILTWWHYIKSSYILISKYNASTLNKKITELVPNKRLLLVEVNLKNKNGWLPLDAWEWLNEQKDKIEQGNVPPIA